MACMYSLTTGLEPIFSPRIRFTSPMYFNLTNDFIIKYVRYDNVYIITIGTSNIANSSVTVPDAHNAFLQELTLSRSFPDSSIE